MKGEIAGICLAAGASTRMGSPKALLEYDGRTWVDVAITNLADGGCYPFLVVIGAHTAEIRDAFGTDYDDHLVDNPDWAAGRTGSIQAGIRAAPDADAYVILPVDHPLVTPADMAAVTDAWRAADRRPAVVRIEHEGRGGHPVLFSPTVAREILTLGPDAPLRDALRPHRDRTITVEGSPGVVVNVDTPEEYAELTGKPTGEVYAHVFENERTGLDRGLFWAIQLDLAPVTIEGEEWDRSLMVEWLTFPARRWRELDGVTLTDVNSPALVEASFYMGEHYPLRLTDLSLHRETGATFRVTAAGTYDLAGWGELDGEDIPLETEGSVEFRGILIVPDNLEPPPGSAEDATDALREFLDPDDLEAPVLEGGSRYVFAPREDTGI